MGNISWSNINNHIDSEAWALYSLGRSTNGWNCDLVKNEAKKQLFNLPKSFSELLDIPQRSFPVKIYRYLELIWCSTNYVRTTEEDRTWYGILPLDVSEIFGQKGWGPDAKVWIARGEVVKTLVENIQDQAASIVTDLKPMTHNYYDIGDLSNRGTIVLHIRVRFDNIYGNQARISDMDINSFKKLTALKSHIWRKFGVPVQFAFTRPDFGQPPKRVSYFQFDRKFASQHGFSSNDTIVLFKNELPDNLIWHVNGFSAAQPVDDTDFGRNVFSVEKVLGI